MAFWFETTDKNWKCGVLYINCSCLLKGLTETKNKQKHFVVENLRLTEVCLFLLRCVYPGCCWWTYMFPQHDIAAWEAQCKQAWSSGHWQERKTKDTRKEISANPAVSSNDSRKSLFELVKVKRAYLEEKLCDWPKYIFFYGWCWLSLWKHNMYVSMRNLI